MNYIISDVAGFIGSLTEEYLAQNHEVIVIDNLFSGKINNINNLPVKFENASITDIAFLKRILEGADGIFHQDAIMSVPRSIKDPLPTNEANITRTLNVLVAVKEMNIARIFIINYLNRGN